MRKTLFQIARNVGPVPGYRDGGPIRGPGTSTSDSIPARLSKGEFVLPADTVRKVGVKSLRDLVHRTHMPSGKPHHPARFVDGGPVDDANKRPNSFGDAAAAARDPSVAQVGAAPAGQPPVAPAPAGPSLAAAAFPNTARAIGGAMDDARTAYQQGGLGAALGQSARVMGAPLIGLADDVATGAKTVLNPAAQALKTFATGDATPIGQEPQPQTTPAAPTTLTPTPGAQTDVQRGGASAPAPDVAPTPLSQQAAQATAPASTAVQALSQVPSLAPVQAQGFSAPQIHATKGSWQTENDLRNARVSASSITNDGGRWDQHKGISPARAAYAQALATDAALQDEQAKADRQAMDQGQANARTAMQQTGDNQRTAINAQRYDEANQIARGRLTLEQIAAGHQNRTSDRVERAQVELENAKTPEAQRSARERLLALAGKAPQNEWGVQVTPTTKNPDGSTTHGSVYRYNKTTGETVRVDDGQGGAAPSKNHAAALRANPGQAALFDEIYGKGAAARILGG